MDFHQTEGIVLSSMPFKDYDRLVTLLSPDLGIIKFYVRGALRPKSTFFGLLEPLTHALYVFKPKRGEFHTLIEGKLINPFLELRDDFDKLQCALDWLRLILKTQSADHPSHESFLLLKRYLNQLKYFDQVDLLKGSYYLKQLLIEGVLNLKNRCARCQEVKDPLFLVKKDYYCRSCCFSHDFPLQQQELQTLLELLKIRSFESLKSLSLEKSLSLKIKKLCSALSEVEW